MNDTVANFLAEAEELDKCVDALSAGQWRTPTPAQGWTIAHQIGHLAWTDAVACSSIQGDPDFELVLAEAAADPLGFADKMAAEWMRLDPRELLEVWRTGRTRLAECLLGLDSSTRIRWFGPSMGARAMATARLMETWAHGQDVVDALGIERQPTARLRDIAFLGFRTREFAYTLHGEPAPEATLYLELSGPDGELWVWGDSSARDVVSGTALEFCLVVTQRRAFEHTALKATPDARRWLKFAQAFAGPPTVFSRRAAAQGAANLRPGSSDPSVVREEARRKDAK